MANILMVDDSKFMRTLLSDIFTGEGHRIVGEAENAKEGLELYRQLNPDLVTLDIIMPEVEGVDALVALKEIVKTHTGANVIVVSAMGQSEVVQQCLSAGAKDFIMKPFRAEDVVRVIRSVLQGESQPV